MNNIVERNAIHIYHGFLVAEVREMQSVYKIQIFCKAKTQCLEDAHLFLMRIRDISPVSYQKKDQKCNHPGLFFFNVIH